jgi:hypothetical protein
MMVYIKLNIVQKTVRLDVKLKVCYIRTKMQYIKKLKGKNLEASLQIKYSIIINNIHL